MRAADYHRVAAWLGCVLSLARAEGGAPSPREPFLCDLVSARASPRVVAPLPLPPARQTGGRGIKKAMSDNVQKYFNLYYAQLTQGCGVAGSACEHEDCRKFPGGGADVPSQAAAQAILLAARGPAKLCANATLAKLETMVETAVCCHEAGVGEDAFDDLLASIKEVFGGAAGGLLPTQLGAAAALEHFDVHLAASVFRQISSAHECVATAFASELKALMARSRGAKNVAVVAGLVSLATDAMLEPNNFDFLVAPVFDEIHRAASSGRPDGAADVVKLWAKVRPAGASPQQPHAFVQYCTSSGVVLVPTCGRAHAAAPCELPVCILFASSPGWPGG